MKIDPAALAAEALRAAGAVRAFLVEQGRTHEQARRRVIVEATEAVLQAALALPGARSTPPGMILDRSADAEINGLSWFIVDPLPGGFRVIDTGASRPSSAT